MGFSNFSLLFALVVLLWWLFSNLPLPREARFLLFTGVLATVMVLVITVGGIGDPLLLNNAAPPPRVELAAGMIHPDCDIREIFIN
jgi:hypothetical protein